ncbi:MAG: Uma2 family endonuclease [Gemmatimonadetes bacterium]|nr:Uma2 family endonuclease [Gemmatimonadota bacterium]
MDPQGGPRTFRRRQSIRARRRRVDQPDLFVVPLLDGRKPREWHECGTPLLVVEILSPTTARSNAPPSSRPAWAKSGWWTSTPGWWSGGGRTTPDPRS